MKPSSQRRLLLQKGWENLALFSVTSMSPFSPHKPLPSLNVSKCSEYLRMQLAPCARMYTIFISSDWLRVSQQDGFQVVPYMLHKRSRRSLGALPALPLLLPVSLQRSGQVVPIVSAPKLSLLPVRTCLNFHVWPWRVTQWLRCATQETVVDNGIRTSRLGRRPDLFMVWPMSDSSMLRTQQRASSGGVPMMFRWQEAHDPQVS